MKRRCDLCEFWERFMEEGYGTCLRFPPSIPSQNPEAIPGQAFPPSTVQDEWCGEFRLSRSQ